VREVRIAALTPQAVGFPVAQLFALPAATSASNDEHLRGGIPWGARDKIDMVLRERQVAGAKRQLTIVYIAFDGAYARLLKPTYAMTRQVDDLTFWDISLPLFMRPFLERIEQRGRKMLTGKAGELLVWLADDRTSVVINWKTMVYIGVPPWPLFDDKTTEMCDRTATGFWRPKVLDSTLATAVQAYRD
jgi:hypothetical protein